MRYRRWQPVGATTVSIRAEPKEVREGGGDCYLDEGLAGVRRTGDAPVQRTAVGGQGAREVFVAQVGGEQLSKHSDAGPGVSSKHR